MAHVYSPENLTHLCQTALISQMDAMERLKAYHQFPNWQQRVQEVNQKVHSLNVVFDLVENLQKDHPITISCKILCKVDTPDNDTDDNGNGNGNDNDNDNGPTVLGFKNACIRTDTLTKWNCLQYPNIEQDGMTLKTLIEILIIFPNLQKVVFIKGGGSYYPLRPKGLLKRFRPFAVFDPETVYLSAKVDGLAIPHLVLSQEGTPADLPLRHSVTRFWHRKIYFFSYSILPLIVAAFPNLCTLLLERQLRFCHDLFPVLTTLAALPRLSKLKLDISLMEKDRRTWNRLEASIDARPSSCLQSLKSLELSIVVLEHDTLAMVLQKLELPSLEEIILKRIVCQSNSCNIDSNYERQMEGKEFEKCVWNALQTLHRRYPSVPFSQINYRMRQHYKKAKFCMPG